MTLPLTSETLRAAYDYLRTTPPFSRWKLPASYEVAFKVGRQNDVRGAHHYKYDDQSHEVIISEVCVGRTDSLLATMAHEMIHVHQQHAKHGAEFKRFAKAVCKRHGFDLQLF